MLKNVLEYLEKSAAAFPDKVAFADDKRQIRFGDLYRQARQCGCYLSEQTKGVLRQPVAVFIDREIESIVAFLGVVYSGNFYVPIDFRLPLKRIQVILETLKPAAVLVYQDHEKLLEDIECSVPVLDMRKAGQALMDERRLEAVRRQSLDADPLYCMFTSGSTGVPKGVLISQRSVIDLTEQFAAEFGFSENTVFGNQAPFDFDVSVKDIYSGLRAGATVHILPRILFSFPGKLVEQLNEKQINTVIWATSALRIVENLKAFAQGTPDSLETVMFSGEVMPNRVLNYWRRHLPEIQYVNLYGPTEITCNCTFYKVDRKFSDEEALPIGVPFDNTGVLLLDEEDQPADEGEICVTGNSLALGYYNNPEKTAEVFCQNPLNKAYPEKIYRTGDIGTYDKNGNLLFLSRKDDQIKHMGHRIELGEIEIAANACVFLDAAVCIYDEIREKIFLFYQAGEKRDRDILKEMGKSLPKYMLPNKLHWMEKLPLNKNAKIDRVKLRTEFLDIRGKRQ